MRLKKLELNGFKSFADRTEFVYEPGITAIVGPNGCGKSNVVDAVKWILGEQSVKSLRGKEMSDVIFSGSGARKSLAYAEATLTLDNADRKLGLEFDEVAITRRVDRTGEGSYFINKKPCRLKDIKNLLLDTGMGMQCYSVIEQGKIDQIIVTSTAERRRVFDEAAGISKYKARRKEAQAKLERVEQNLLRLNDIVDEVEKQLRSVKYQAAKARRYRQYVDELKTLRVSYSLREYDRFTTQSTEKGERLRAREDEHTRLGVESDRADTERHACEMRALELEQSQESAQGTLAGLRQAAAAAEDAIRFNTSRIREQVELREQFQRQKTSLEERTVGMREEVASRRGELNGLLRRLGDETQTLDEKETTLQRMSGEERDIAQDLERRKTEVVDLMQQSSRIENELGVVLSEKRTLEMQRARKTARIDEVTAQLGADEGRIREAEDEIAAIDRVLEGLAGETREKHVRQQELVGRLASMRDTLSDLRERQSGIESRLDVLREMNEKQEGVEQGVREVLERFRAREDGAAGLCGMLGENLSVDAQYAPAVEAALGHRAQTLVVEHRDHATEALRELTESGKGRASFLPLSHCTVKPNGHTPPEGVIGYLKDFVRCDDRHRRVVECLLGDVLLVSDLDGAWALKALGTNGSVLVTLSGEVVEPTGMITGGRGITGGGIISRSAERQSLTVELDGLRGEIASAAEALRASERSQDAITEEIRHLGDLVERERGTRGAKVAHLERLREKARMLADERDILVSERSELEREGVELDGRERELRTRLDAVRREDQELEGRIGTLTASHE
ncbi:MAG TPA: chromosome segregation protein SMC, partial [Planctomycetota bacterium]|nr:chromosome segregation protein SMC [Planctomycetota bacterium]